MKIRTLTMVVAGAFCALTAVADNPTFTGAVDGDLTKAENWNPAAVPDSSAVVSISPTSTRYAYTIPASKTFAVKGIEFTPSRSFEINGDGALSVGEKGVTCLKSSGSDWSFTLRVPVTITTAQLWDFKTNAFTTTKAFTGTYNLVFTNLSWITHNAALKYDGKIFYYAAKAGHTLEYKSSEKWANSVLFSRLRPCFQGTGEYDWETLFPGKEQIVQKIWSSSGLRFANVEGAVMNFKTGDDVKTEGDGPSFGPGTFNMLGGTIYLDGVVSFNDKARLNIYDSSSLTCKYGLHVTTSSSSQPMLNTQVNQYGGTVEMKSFIQIGGRHGNATVLGEYVMRGGTFTAGTYASDSTDHGLHLVSTKHSSTTAYTDPSVGVFSQRGGVTKLTAVNFGSDRADWDEKVTTVTNGFGLLSIEGGTFMPGYRDFRFGTGWNKIVNATEGGYMDCPWAEGRYRIRLSGGEYVPYINRSSEYLQQFQWDIAPGSDAGVTVVCTNRQFVQSAPISGNGTLVMSGANGSSFTDLSRFTGKLVVDKGVSTVAGIDITTGTYDDGCVIFRADDAAKDKSTGAEVASWTAANTNLTATTLSGVCSQATNCCLNPTILLNDFNGHAGLKFDTSGVNVSALGLTTADNPLIGSEDYTIAVVFKTTMKGSMGITHDYQIAYSSCLIGNSCVYAWNDAYVAISKEGYMLGGRCFLDSDSKYTHTSADRFTRVTSGPRTANDGKVHVFVSGASKQVVRATLDGWCSETNRNIMATDLIYPIGCKQNSYTPQANAPLMIGTTGKFVWGAESDKANPNYAYKGTIAEIRLYPKKCLSMDEMIGLSYELNQKYNPDAKSTDNFVRGMNRAVKGTWTDVRDDAVALPTGATEFTADSATVSAGSEVTALMSTDGAKTLTSTVGGGAQGPTLVKNAVGTKSALRFTAANKCALGLAAASSPLNAASSCAIAVVFRTTTDGIATNAFRSGRGLVSTVQGTSESEDLSIEFQGEGTMLTGFGSASNGAMKFSRKPCRLADGQFHVAILNGDLDNDQLTQMVDGLPQYAELKTTQSRGAYDVLIGSLCKTMDGNYFDGDIAAVAMWPRALSREEMDNVTEHYAQEYSFYPLAKGKFTTDDLTERGISAREIEVTNGGSLVLTESATSPFTLKSYQTVTGNGKVRGSLRWGAGSTYDTDTAAKDVEDVQFKDATIKFGADSLPFDGSRISSISGAMTLDVSAVFSGTPALRTKLMTLKSGVVKDGTTFTIVGLEGISRAYYDEAQGGLVLHVPRGTVILMW